MILRARFILRFKALIEPLLPLGAEQLPGGEHGPEKRDQQPDTEGEQLPKFSLNVHIDVFLI